MWKNAFQNLSIRVLPKETVKLVVVLSRYLAFFHQRIRVPMVKDDRNCPFSTHAFEDITMGDVHHYHALYIERSLNKLSGPVIDSIHRRAERKVLLSMRVDLIIVLQAFSAKLFHLGEGRHSKNRLEDSLNAFDLLNFGCGREFVVESSQGPLAAVNSAR